MDAPMNETWQESTLSEIEQRSSKKRKIRKGTQSCWECKRRKTRCTFSTPADATCDGCRSRHTNCVSQEYEDEVGPVRKQADRLHLVETIVQKLVDKTSLDQPPTSSHRAEGDTHGDHEHLSSLQPDYEEQLHDDLNEVSSTLLKAWPTQNELKLILAFPVNVSILFHGVVCLPYRKFFSTQIVPPEQMLHPPKPGAHPVLVARKLLMLATWIQGVPPEVDPSTDLNYHRIMSRAVKISSRLVTSNDDLVDSIEGIECIMIESMYQNNAGNLRRAWLTNRRAMFAAQLLGLHLGCELRSSYLDASTHQRIDPNYMWFRIVYSDRYLSLMLGLPQGCLEAGVPSSLDGYTPLERFERIICAATGLTLQRNSVEQTESDTTSKIDRMLQDAAALMPPRWWLAAPDLVAIASNGSAAFEETIRLTTQIAHHHLLVQLHLPYLLVAPSDSQRYDSSRLIAANASRTILTQFASFRNSDLATSYCRGFDFVAFVASVTLCLAHIKARQQHQSNCAFQSIKHQRLSDRGLLERCLEILETVVRKGDDILAKKICSILQPLLVIEDASRAGMRYDARAIDNNPDPQSHTKPSADTLRIEIPYYGTIKIEHCAEPEGNSSGDAALPQDDSRLVTQEPHHGAVPATDSVGYAFSNTPPVNSDWQDVPSFIDPSMLQNPNSQSLGGSGTHLLVPSLSCEVDEWALQGVDMALFSNLLPRPNVNESRVDGV